jgi:hypothetical protein
MAIVGYEYRMDGGSPIDIGLPDPLTFTVEELAAATEYDFEIRGYDAEGNRTAWSNIATAVTDGSLPPEFVNLGPFEYSVGAITPGIPAGTAENDILLLPLFTFGQAIDVPGWTELLSPVDEGTYGIRLSVFWKRAGSSESAPTTTDSGIINVGGIIGFSGCVTTGNPFEAVAMSSDADTGGDIVIPGITTLGPNRTVIKLVTEYITSGTSARFTGWANSNLSDIVEVIDNAGGNGSIGAIAGKKILSGATGDTTASRSPSDASTKIYFRAALIPA